MIYQNVFDTFFNNFDKLIYKINIIDIYIYDFIDHIFYINLDKRLDRKKTAEIELKKIDPDLKNVTRFSARDALILKISPQKACAMSHMECVKIAKEKRYKNVLIFEDDFFFNKPIDIVLKDLKDFFQYINNDYTFFLLGTYNNFSYENVYKKINKVIHSFSMTGYIVNSSFYQEWINVCEQNLAQNFVAIDGLWCQYQGKKSKSYTCNTNEYRLIRQYDGYSDIAKKNRKITW